MFDFFEQIDQQLFLLINGWHSMFFDRLMFFISEKYTWVPLYVVLLFFVVRSNKKAWWLSILAIIVLITLADQLSVHLFKEQFMRYRPCHNLNLHDLVHTVKGHCGGRYGFVSSHAANSFAVAGFVSLFLKKQWLSMLLLTWAALVSYSRIYLGVHYPADVFCGGLLGLFVSWIVYKLYNFLQLKLIR